ISFSQSALSSLQARERSSTDPVAFRVPPHPHRAPSLSGVTGTSTNPGARGGHAHSHGVVDDAIRRSRGGVRAVALSLAVLGAAALAQIAVFLASGSVALLADLIHNFGDAATAFPLGIAFLVRSDRAERWAGLAVVAAIFISACVVGAEAVARLVHPST